MKRLIWQFKKSPFANQLLRRVKQQQSPFVLTALTIAVVAGCRIFQTSSPEDDLQVEQKTTTTLGLRADKTAPLPLLSSIKAEEDVKLVKILGSHQQPLAELAAPSCSPGQEASALHVRLLFSSPFGSHLAIVSRAAGVSDQAAATIESRRLAFAINPLTTNEINKLACLALETKSAAPQFTADENLQSVMREWLMHIAPDCNFASGANGFVCTLPAATIEVAKQELDGIRTAMIQRWSRQPYLLSRRLAVADLLAQALGSADRDHKLKTFCNIVKHSLPLELPATIGSQRWRESVCQGQTADQINAALFGLSKAVDEIEFLRQLFERTSRLGSLTVRLPREQVPNAILVSLVPDSGVTDNLTKETAKLWLTDTPQGKKDAALAEGQPKACWHPVYGEDTGLLQLARHLVLAGEAPGITCMEDVNMPPKSNFSIEHYLAESIASETEFVLENGRSQTLRLPAGRYSYRLQNLPENPEEWDDAAANGPQATGTIEWESQRPRAMITQW